MDPQTLAFTPRDDFWRFQSDMLRVQQAQAEHGERLLRLEKRLDDEGRMKSVWSSPFPTVLSSTPQQDPLPHPAEEAFNGFDDHQSNLIGSLHLDADDEPRRVGATSRANSVRFDESANQGHWSHTSRSSLELIPRTGSGFGGHPMIERTSSHKSDGRQSSAGQSIHSTASGRVNSLALDTNQALNHSMPSPNGHSLVPPGLFVLGSVPSIIRCWLNTNFKHESLLYAVVCSGSYSSLLDARLVDRLGFGNQVWNDDEGTRRIKLAVYLPEAVPHQASSRSSSPAPQLPTLTVEFIVINGCATDAESKDIQIVLGSDLLRSRNGDVLFSSNSMIIFDDERTKLSVPFVRPEDDRTFKFLHLSGQSRFNPAGNESPSLESNHIARSDASNSEVAVKSAEAEDVRSSDALSPTSTNHTDIKVPDPKTPSETSRASEDASVGSGTPQNLNQPVGLTTTNIAGGRGSLGTPAVNTTPSRKSSSSSVWGSWRRDTDKTGQSEPGNLGRVGSLNYQRRDQGIKVLKPGKLMSRSFSAAHTNTSSPSSAGQSRYFDDGRRRSSTFKDASDGHIRKNMAEDTRFLPKEGQIQQGQSFLTKPKSTNPVGGASAFAWLNAGASK